MLVGLAGCQTPVGSNAGAPSVATHADRELHILVVADLHIDPFRNGPLVNKLEAEPIEGWPYLLQSDDKAPYASVGRDANPSLILSAFSFMHQVVPHPDVVFVAGDLLGHAFHDHFLETAHDTSDAAYQRFVDKTAEITPLALHALYPHAQILPTVGNNDGYCGDYRSTPRDKFLAHQTAQWEPYTNMHGLAPHFAQTYANAGYYEAHLPNGLRVLGLNSVLFSAAYENACGDPDTNPAGDELTWLHARLSEPNAPPTLILTHIPVGIDAFKTFLHLGKPLSFYNDDVQNTVIHDVQMPTAHVTAFVTGHLHDVAYRVIPAHTAFSPTGIPVYSAPAISPIFGNAPAFAELDVSPQGRIDNITVYELGTQVPHFRTQPGWYRAYDFNSRYGLNGVTGASIRHLHELEQSNLTLRQTVERDRVGGGPAGAIGGISWRTSWCSELTLDIKSYLGCEGVPKNVTPPTGH
jgi:sphingomyelin phosphodiesterase acid-like 3